MSAGVAISRPRGRSSVGSEHAPDDDRIYRELLSAIIQHRIMPGTRLPEEELARAFNVNRMRVRAILRRLAHENLVTIRRNRGASVACLSAKEARDVFAVRRMIEPAAAGLLAATISSRAIKSLRQFVENEREAQKAGDQRRGIALSGEFHLRLIQELDNSKLDGFLRELVSQTSLVVAVYGGADQGSCRCDDHAELLDLLAAHDRKGAAARMRHHLEAVEASLRLDPTHEEPVSLQEIFARHRAD